MWIDPWPTMYGDPNRSRRRDAGDGSEGRGLGGFFEDAFAVVFGGANPNEGFDEQRWRAIGERIALNGGVVAGEQILPLLDVPQESDLEVRHLARVFVHTRTLSDDTRQFGPRLGQIMFGIILVCGSGLFKPDSSKAPPPATTFVLHRWRSFVV